MLHHALTAAVLLAFAWGAHASPGADPGIALALMALGIAVLAAGTVQGLLGALWRGLSARPGPARPRSAHRATPARPPAPDTRKRIVVDGSNVMFWSHETPTLAALTAVLDALIARHFAPVVFFDANVGHKLFGAYCGPSEMRRYLPSGVADVIVVDKGEPADPVLIARALQTGARIVSNDRFRDWREQFPALSGKGVLVPGEMRGGAVELRL